MVAGREQPRVSGTGARPRARDRARERRAGAPARAPRGPSPVMLSSAAVRAARRSSPACASSSAARGSMPNRCAASYSAVRTWRVGGSPTSLGPPPPPASPCRPTPAAAVASLTRPTCEHDRVLPVAHSLCLAAGDEVDVFHTFFGIAGLALLGTDGVPPIDPAYALPVSVMTRLRKQQGSAPA